MPTYDLAVVGGGIIGLATAMAWQARYPGAAVTLLEKEPALASHQTGHNSGVIHSGIYYRPGSLKAKTCVEGARLMVAFCQAQGIPYKICGKLVVASTPAELPQLEALCQRGQANGVPGLRLLPPEQFQDLEPHARGLRALHVPGVGIVDYRAVAHAMAVLIQQHGGVIQTGFAVHALQRAAGLWRIETPRGDVRARRLVVCAGLQGDRVAARAGVPRGVTIIPFRGEYYDLRPARQHLVQALIYPVPNPAFPFLGVHFTRTIEGRVHAGPNAVLAWQREGYRASDISLGDLWALVRHPGFWRMAGTYWRTGAGELYRSWSKAAFVHALQRLVPDITAPDLVPGGSGVRAQAIDATGRLLDDFDLLPGDGVVYVRNVPSPAATASLRIGQVIAALAGAAPGQPRSHAAAEAPLDAAGSVR